MTLDQARHFAMSLPETTEEPHFHYTSFRVRGRIFATAPPGDEDLHVFVTAEQRDAALAREPDFLEALRWGTLEAGSTWTTFNRSFRTAKIPRLVASASP